MDDHLQRVQMQQQVGPITAPSMMQTTQESEAVMAPSMMEQMLQQEASESGSYSWKSGREADLQYLGKGRVGDFSGLQGTTIEEVLSRIPEAARRRELIPIEGKVTEGFEYKWTQEGKTYRVRIHGKDASAPAGSNAANGWVVRVQQGKKYLDPVSLQYQSPGITNPASQKYSEVLANRTHIPIQNPQ